MVRLPAQCIVSLKVLTRTEVQDEYVCECIFDDATACFSSLSFKWTFYV